jgi:hypothetical protein
LISDIDETKIWNYYALENKNELHYLGYKYKFDANKYEIYKGDISEVKANFNKDFVIDNLDNKWSFDSESSRLHFGLDSFIIERYNTDTIFMRGDGFEGRFMMVRMKDLEDYSK